MADIKTHMAPKEMDDTDYPSLLIYKGTRFPFNPHKVIYGEVKPTNHGGFMIQCKYPIDGKLADGTPIRGLADILLQTPVMSTTFGMSTKEHDAGKIRGTIDVSFYDDAEDDVKAFKDTLELWDTLLLNKAKKEKKEWFKSDKVTNDILQYLYNPMKRSNVSKKDGKVFCDSFRAKVPRRFNRWDSEVFDASQNPISLDEITRQCQLRMLVRHTGIWFGTQMFVSSFDIPQIQKVGEGRMTGYSFVGDGDSDNFQSEGGFAMTE
jgi:hypothetical protein